MRLFCIVDLKTNSLCMTFTSISEATARRSFEDLIAAPEPSVFSLHPEDFVLFSACDLATEIGIPIVVAGVERICSGSDYSAAVLKTLREARINQFNFSAVKEESVNE